MTSADALVQAIDRYKKSRPSMRKAMHQSAVATATQLSKERNDMVDRLNKRWDWCDANPSHPAFEEREDAVLIDLAVYEQMETVLMVALQELYGEAA